MLGRRKEKEAEGGKWGLVGGTGAFWEGAESLVDFAFKEVVYDLKVSVDPEKLRYFTNKIKPSRKSLIVEVTGNEKAPDACQWFSIEQIRMMQERGEVAFDNYEVLEEFHGQN